MAGISQTRLLCFVSDEHTLSFSELQKGNTATINIETSLGSEAIPQHLMFDLTEKEIWQLYEYTGALIDKMKKS